MSWKSKQRKKARREREAQEDGHHLDRTITNIAVSTTSSLHKYWKPITAFVVILCATIVVFKVMQTIAEAREARYQDRLRSLMDDAGDRTLDLEEARKLAEDLRGAEIEKFALKRIVQELMAQADELRNRVAGADAKPDTADASRRRKVLDAAAEIAAAGKRRFPQDEDIALWAENVEKKIRAESDTSWLPPGRSYEMQPPPELAADPAEKEVDAEPAVAPEEPAPQGGEESGGEDTAKKEGAGSAPPGEAGESPPASGGLPDPSATPGS